MTEQEATALKERAAQLEQDNARLKEAQILREAKDVVAKRLATIDMSELTRARLTEALAKHPVMVDGGIDVAAFETKIDEAAASELEYLQKATGVGTGHISGMGGSTPAGSEDTAALHTSLTESFSVLGLNADEAKIAATGRG